MGTYIEQVSYFAARASEEDVKAHTKTWTVQEVQKFIKDGKPWKKVAMVTKRSTREEAKLAYGLAMADTINKSERFN